MEPLEPFEVNEPSWEELVDEKAKEVFLLWYDHWYKGRYHQRPATIIKAFKEAIDAGILPDDLWWASCILGKEAKEITSLNIQWALSEVHKEKAASHAAIDLTDKNRGKYSATL